MQFYSNTIADTRTRKCYSKHLWTDLTIYLLQWFGLKFASQSHQQTMRKYISENNNNNKIADKMGEMSGKRQA